MEDPKMDNCISIEVPSMRRQAEGDDIPINFTMTPYRAQDDRGTLTTSSDLECRHRRTYLFGHPISHSVSPIFHNLVFETLNLPWSYTLLESRNVRDLQRVVQLSDFIGSAVTMPNKIIVMKLMDELTEEATVIGAINTIFVRERDG